MRAFASFLKKEIVEYSKTYKLLILAAVAVLFGIMNPVAAKLMPELFKLLAQEGINITMPAPTAMDSWTQFYKNMTGMQIIVFVIVFCGIFANELNKGTLINMLTKGLARKTVVFAKLTGICLTWTASYTATLLITYGYSLYLLPGNDLPNIWFAAFCMWLYGTVIACAVILSGVLFSNIYCSLLMTGGVVVVLTLIDFIPNVRDFCPNRLSNENMKLLSDELQPSELTGAVVVAVCLCVVFAAAAIMIFDKKRL